MPTLLNESIVSISFDDEDRRVNLVHKPKPRYPGIHESDILQYVAYEVGWLKQGERQEEDYPWRWAMGKAWEEYWFSLPWAQEATEWQPGEIVKDEIAGNADGLTSDDTWGILIEETKCTEKKVKTGEELLGERMWMHQGMSYCYLYNTQVVRWVPQFYRGDYRGSGPIVKTYTVLFSQTEILQNWSMLRKYRDRVAQSRFGV